MNLTGIVFRTPTLNHGQVVCRSYAWHNDKLYRRTFDASEDGAVRIDVCKHRKPKIPLALKEWDWREDPPVDAKDWREV